MSLDHDRHPHLSPGEYIDSEHPAVRRHERAVTAGMTTPRQRAIALFEAVRDLPYEADDFDDLETYRASHVLDAGHGYCVSKAALFVALLRSAGIPARIAFADVRNHLASPRLRRAMGTDLFAWHGYGEARLGGRWVAASPTFDPATCRRAGVAPLTFDGEHDALLQSFDGERAMTYVRRHGSFHDVPARFLAAEMPRLYPFTANGGITRFKAEAATMTDAGLDLLIERGAGDLAHPGGTLGAHLRRVGDRLTSHGVDQSVRTAGLCHAAYGTDGYPHALIGLDERARVRAVIGSAAEAIVYLYASCDRARTYPSLADDPVHFVDRFSGEATSTRRTRLRAFAALTVANELDVLDHAPAAPAGRAALKRVVEAVADLLTPAALDDARRALAPRGRR